MLDNNIFPPLEQSIGATLASVKTAMSRSGMDASKYHCSCVSNVSQAAHSFSDEASADSIPRLRPSCGGPKTTKRPAPPIKTKAKDDDKVKSEDIKQLKIELKAIKEQLLVLTRNKNEAMKKCLDQEHCIDGLEQENHKLREQLEQTNSTDYSYMVRAKENMDEYGEKLSQLYDEFVESSKVMEQNRDMLCNCIKKKSMQFREMSETQGKVLEDKTNKYDDLNRKYQTLLSNLDQQQLKNQELVEEGDKLQNHLNETMEYLEKIKAKEKQMQSEIDKLQCNNCCLSSQLKEKTALVQELEQELTQTSEELEPLKDKYDSLSAEYQILVHKFKINEQNDLQKYGEMQCCVRSAQDKEKTLLIEQQEMKTFITEMTERIKDQDEIVARLNCMIQEKEFVIQSLQTELSMKDRQLELSAESVAKDYSSRPQEENVCTSECSSLPNLSEELQNLINALYLEIDKTLSKERIIRKQFKEICSLQGILASKDKELICLRYQLDLVKRKVEESLRSKQKQLKIDSLLPKIDHNQQLIDHNQQLIDDMCACPDHGPTSPWPPKANVLFCQEDYSSDEASSFDCNTSDSKPESQNTCGCCDVQEQNQTNCKAERSQNGRRITFSRIPIRS